MPSKLGSTDDNRGIPQGERVNESLNSVQDIDRNIGNIGYPLYRSTRLKGYITFIIASTVNYNAALDCQKTNTDDVDQGNIVYAQSASLITMILCIFLVIIHLDQCTPLQGVWQEAFKPGSKIELFILLFLIIWWVTATVINTSSWGIAGDGSGQLNIYFSTWVCCWNSFSMVEKWLVGTGAQSFNAFLRQWPHRAPGWMAMFFSSLSALLAYLELSRHMEDERGITLQGSFSLAFEWWLFVVCGMTIVASCALWIIEIFRISTEGDNKKEKSDVENVSEGVLLCILAILWIPTVTLATMPGNPASRIGNSYFFSWFTTIFSIQTFIWWVYDWRMNIRKVLEDQRTSYKKAKQTAFVLSQRSTEEGDDLSLEDK